MARIVLLSKLLAFFSS
ncbi:hypothetical protein VTN00DRAFT_5951 [Thermoascus crustaceus]